MAVICFDFDGVSSDKRIQQLIRKLVRDKNEVWIVTMRRENEFNKTKLKPVLQIAGLTEYNVVYCSDKPKLEMLEMLNADVYIDNQSDEFENILNYSNIIPLLFQSKN